jgi:signal peptide peptidase SppA
VKHRSRFEKRGALAFRADFLSFLFDVDDAKREYELRDNVAIVTIEGPLTQKSEWWWDSYEAIRGRVAAAMDSSADTIVLRIDSPGGVVCGCFETVAELQDMAARAGKKIVAYADAMAASAGYALACAATEIYLPATGFVGSIGVITTLVDEVELDRKIGLNFAVIASGERKRYGHPNVPISDAAVSNAQKQVDTLAELFFESVSAARGIPVAELRALEAGMLIGQQAVSARLADGVCTFEDLIGRLTSGTASAPTSARTKENEMSWKDALKKAADEGDEEAKKALGALEDDEKKDDKAESEDDEKKDDKAESEDDEKKDDKAESEDDEKMSSAKSSDPGLDMAATVQSLAAWKADHEEREERAALMAKRPDLASEVVAFLARQPLSVVRDAVKTLPRGVAAKGQVAAARAALTTAPTVQAEPTAGGSDYQPHDLDVQMGLAKPIQKIRHEGTRLSIGVMTPAEARAELARRQQKAAGGAK